MFMMKSVKLGAKPNVILGVIGHSSEKFTRDAYLHIIGEHTKRGYGEGCPSGLW